jgi:acetoin utilization deacetylase AcuC-like enzyme
VLFMSIHADPRADYPWYLGHADETGEGEGLGHNMNLVLARGATSVQWFAALETACLKMAAYAPQALVVSLGGGPQSGAFLASADFLRVGERIGYLELPTVFVLEGGAAQPDLGTNVVNVLEGFETGA